MAAYLPFSVHANLSESLVNAEQNQTVSYQLALQSQITIDDLRALNHGIFVEDKDSPYVNIIVAREENKDNPEVKQFIDSFQSDEVEQAADRLFEGSSVKGW